MTKRLRPPRMKDGELAVYWGRSTRNEAPDICFAYQGDSRMKADTRLIFYHLCCQKPDPHKTPLWSVMQPSLIEELTARGYDITTLKFSIQKLPTTKERKQ